jgi:hypothetical protein
MDVAKTHQRQGHKITRTLKQAHVSGPNAIARRRVSGPSVAMVKSQHEPGHQARERSSDANNTRGSRRDGRGIQSKRRRGHA